LAPPSEGSVLICGHTTQGAGPEQLAGIARDHGRAVLVVTHDSRLLEFADRILYIEDGTLTYEEKPGANVFRLRA
jgi:ABC-type lipoprotein export system ATPase subunit